MTRFRDLIKGALASSAILFLLGGVPVVLFSVIGMPFAELIGDLTDPLTSDATKAAAALRLGLSAIVLLAWGQVAWSLLVELVAVARGRAASSSRLVPAPIQRSARHLVAIAMLLLTVFATPAAATGLNALTDPGMAESLDGHPLDSGWPAVDEIFTAVDQTGIDGSPPNLEALAETADIGDVEYVVQPGDTFWSLAERGLGDGFRWRQIREANHGRVMADGSVISGSTELLQAGSIVRVPQSLSSPSATGDTATGPVTVTDGDHFWSLAHDRLAASWGRAPTDDELTPYWSEMLLLNEDRLLPPGDPDLIHPGQELMYPPVPRPPTPAETDVDGSRGKPSPTGSAQPTDNVRLSQGSTESTAAPRPIPPTPPPATAAATPGTSTAAADRLAPSAPGDTTELPAEAEAAAPGPADPTQGEDNVPVGVVAISGIGLVTAAVGGIIARNQARRIGGRRPGTVPRFDVSAAAESLISETSDEPALADLDRALRHLGSRLDAEDLAMPDLVGVLLGPDDIRLLVATPHNAPPAPFTVDRDGMVWSIARPVPRFGGPPALNPYPTLVSIGFTESARLLVDLEYVGSLSVSGGFADIVDAMGTMALQLATSPLADTIDVVCVGFGEELADLERITVVPSVDALASRVAEHAAGAAALIAATDSNGPTGRAAGVGDWTPLVVFDPLSELAGSSSDLLTAVEQTPLAGVSAVVNSVDSAALAMELTDDRVSIPSYGVDLDRRPLTRVERTDLSSAVSAAKDPGHTLTPDLLAALGGPTPPETPTSTDAAAGNNGDTTAQPHDYIVRLLGPLRVEDRDGQGVQFARSATPEFLAYLVHHRDGAEVGHVMDTLWPSTTARRTWIANVYADAARSLDSADGGVTLTPRPGADDEYRLATGVISDVERFRALVTAAVSRSADEAVELLTEALAMIGGIPYANITSRWPITEGHWQEATVMVDEAARCVAALALDQFDDPTLAEWATSQGLLASPHSVELHRLRLRAAIALDTDQSSPSDRSLSPDAVFQHYQAVVMADDHRPEAASQLDTDLVDLYESYRRSKPGPVRSIDSDTLEPQH